MVSATMPEPIPAQVERLRQLRPGWLTPDTPTPDPAGLDWLQQQYEQHYPDDAALPALFPTEDGNVQAEWRLGRWGAELVTDLANHRGLWGTSLPQPPYQGEERTLNLDDPSDWNWLANRLAQLQSDPG